MADNQTRIIISAVDNTRTALNSVDSGLRGLSDRAESVSKAFGSVASSVASLVAVGGISTKIIDVQRQFDVLNASLVTMTGSAAQARIAFSALQQFAATTPFSLQEVTTAFVKLKSLGLDPSQRAMESYGNTASAMGKSLNQLIEAVADASTGEFERLKEFGIKASQSGDQVALTFQGVTTTIGKSAAEITDYLTQIGEHQFAGAMAERAKTLDGAISNLADSWDNLFLTVSSGDAGSLIYDSVTLASGAISDITTIVKAMTSAADENKSATGAMAAIQSGIATIFETVAVAGANVAYVFRAVGTELGGLAAQANAVAHLDFSGAKLIGEEMKADAEAARKEIDALSDRILNARSQSVSAAASLDDLAKSAGNAGAALNEGLDKYLADLTNAPKSVKIAAAVEKENAAFREAVKGLEATDARYIKALEAHRQRIAEINKQSSGGTAGRISDYAKLTASIQQAIAAQNVEIATGEKATESEKLRAQITEQLASGQLKLTAAQQAGVAAMIAQLAAGEQNLTRVQAEAALRDEIAKDEENRVKSITQTTEQIQKDTSSIIEHTDQIGKSKAEIEALSAQRDLDTIALKENELAMLESNGQCTAYTAALREQIIALKERAAALQNQSFHQAEQDSKDAAKKVAQQWEKTSDKIGDSITDALMRGFESGKDFAENLKDTVVNMFKTMVLQPTIKATVVSGMSSLGLMGSASASGGSSSGGIGSWLQMGNNAYSLYNGGATSGLYGSFATSSLGQALGLSTVTATGMGALGGLGTGLSAGAGGMGLTLGGGASGLSVGTGLGSGVLQGSALTAGSTGTVGSVGLTSLGTALPYVGLALAAVSMLSSAFSKGGTPHAGGIVYSDGTNVTNPRTAAAIKAEYADPADYKWQYESDWTKRYNQSVADALEPTATAIAKTLNLASDSFGSGGDYKVGLAFSSDGEDKSRGRYSIIDSTGEEVFDWGRKKFDKDAEQGIEDFINATGQGIVAVLKQMDLPSWAAEMVEAVGDKATLEEAGALVEQLTAIQTAAEKMSPALEMTADNFAEIYLKAGDAAMSAYYSLVATSSEQLSDSYRVVSNAFDDLGVAIPDSIDGFRDLITSLDETSEEGQETIASLFQLASAFGTVQQAIDNLKTGVADATYKLRSPQEQAAIQAEKLADAAKEAGVAIPSSVEELLRLADSIDYTTQAGMQLASAMPALAAAFTAAQQAAAAAATNPYTIDTIQSDASDAVDAAFSALESAVEREKEAITSQYESQSAAWESAVSAAEDVKASLESLAETLRNAVDTTAVQSDSLTLSRRASAQNDLNIALAAAMRGQTLTGYTDSITKAISTFSDNSAADLYSSFEDYARAQGRANASIAALADQADLQVTAQDKQIAAIEAAAANAAAFYATQINQLDQVLTDAQSQIDALNGIDTSVMTVAEAIAALSSAIATMSAINTATGTDNRSTGSASQTVTQLYADILGRTPETQGYEYWVSQMMGGATTSQVTSAIAASTEAQTKINDLYETLLNRNAESEGMAYWTHQLELGKTLAEIAEAIKASPEYKSISGVPGYASGGYFSGGWRIVGENGPELEATGAARIFSFAQTRDILSSGPDNTELIEELRQLRAEVVRMQRQLDQTNDNTRRAANAVNGNPEAPMLVEIAA